MTGAANLHDKMDRRVAAFGGRAGDMTFTSGCPANLGVVASRLCAIVVGVTIQ